MTLLLALLACGRDPAADRAAFLVSDCPAIEDTTLRDDCLVSAVKAAPETDAARCPTVTNDAMRDECWFVAIDARELVGEEAARACARAGRFTNGCHANAISREVSALPPLDEAALTVEVERILAVYRRPPSEARDIVRRRLAVVGPE